MGTAATNEPSVPELRARVSQLLDQVRSGQFASLRTEADFLFQRKELFRSANDELTYARVHSLAFEVYDQQGLYDEAKAKLEALVNNEYLPSIESETRTHFLQGVNEEDLESKRKLARQKILCCLGHAFSHYRLGAATKAGEVLDKCRRFLYEVLIEEEAAPKFNCWGTRARLHYYHGQVFRIQRKFSESNDHFRKSLDFARRRLEEQGQRATASKLQIEQLFANHCAGKILACGLGWNARLEGRLENALEFLQAARILLRYSSDHYLRWQVEFLSCSVQRAQIGTSEGLEKLKKDIENCCTELKGHKHYYTQARFECAVLLLQLGHAKRESDPAYANLYLTNALQITNEILADSAEAKRTLPLVLKSRIIRGLGYASAGDEALQCASEAYDAPGSGVHVRAAAAIELAEVYLLRKEYFSAEERLKEALKLSVGDDLVCGACYLHLTDLKLRQESIVPANQWFAMWETISGRIEHKWLHDRAEELRARIDARKMYLITFDDARSFREISKDLFSFLVEREKLRQGSDFSVTKAAARLVVGRDAFASWMEKLANNDAPELQFHTPLSSQKPKKRTKKK